MSSLVHPSLLPASTAAPIQPFLSFLLGLSNNGVLDETCLLCPCTVFNRACNHDPSAAHASPQN